MEATRTEKDRVAAHTAASVNREIRQQTDDAVAYYARHPDEIDARLDALAKEWDVERVLETNAASLALIGMGLGALVDRRWLVLPGVVAAFLLQHALQGWCPPVPVFRRLGVRTKGEILRERYSLRALRGDFDGLAESRDKAPYLRARRVREAMTEDR